MNNYYDYGMEIDAGSWSGGDYNFSYNGMLKEGIGKNIYNTHFRNLSDGRWWSPDPRPNPSNSSYASMKQNPILYIDFAGDTITSTQEGFDIGKEGLDATLGECNPFKYNTQTGTWYEEEGFDPSGLNETHRKVYDNVSSVLKSEKTANIIVVDLNQEFFSNFYNKITSLDKEDGLGLSDFFRIYDDKLGREIHFTTELTNIYLARDLNFGYRDIDKNIRGLTALHELGHIFYYFNYPNMLPTENLFCTSVYELQIRQIYMIPINKISIDSFLNLFRKEKVLNKPLGGKPEWHNSKLENELKW